MDVKNEIKNLVLYAMCQQDAVTFGSARAANGYGQLVGQSLDNIGRWADMAEAAMAYMEHQAASVGDPVADEAAYYRERCRLWDAFMLAKDKAKEVVS